MKYEKGEVLGTKEKFVKWLAQDKAYYRNDELRTYKQLAYSEWNSGNIEPNLSYFQAIPIKEPKKLYAFKESENEQIQWYESDDFDQYDNLERTPEYDREI